MLDEQHAPAPRATIEVGLDQLIAAARTLPPEAREQLRQALDDAAYEAAWMTAPPTGASDPALAQLWNNDDDAVYDQL